MIFRAIDDTGDWVYGSGRQSYGQKDQAIAFDIATYLKTFLTECFFDFSVGIPWFNLLGGSDQALVVLTIKKAIAAIEGVISINDISYSLNADRVLTIKYDISTIYSSNYQGVVTL